MAELRPNCSTLLKVLAALFTVAVPTAALAQTDSNLLHTNGFVEEHNWFSPFALEHVDAVTGNIMLTFTDLALPGNAGRNLRIQRVFNNHFKSGDITRWRF